jgi:hypothetical protein
MEIMQFCKRGGLAGSHAVTGFQLISHLTFLHLDRLGVELAMIFAVSSC